jgi:nanoRNase/pAp phosphatase (c-di-AMP/oligoRNAs hydrolase)
LEAVSAIDAFIDRHDDYLVTAHVRPDGDAWAAICAWWTWKPAPRTM